jgi:hypothetical protein
VLAGSSSPDPAASATKLVRPPSESVTDGSVTESELIVPSQSTTSVSVVAVNVMDEPRLAPVALTSTETV